MTVIQAYIDAQPARTHPHLEALYRCLQNALPQAEERISYGMPAFWDQQVLVYFAANRDFVGFYPTAAPIAAFAAQLSAYHTSKGAIQFPYGDPLPLALIAQIAEWRAAHVTVRTTPKKRPAQPVPDAIAQALAEAGVDAAYAARPQYQRTDYLNWIAQAKRPATQAKRLTQMLEELAAGDVYMKQPWHSRR